MPKLEFTVSLDSIEEGKVDVYASGPSSYSPSSVDELLKALAASTKRRLEVSEDCVAKVLRALSGKDVIEVCLYYNGKHVGSVELDLSGDDYPAFVMEILAHTKIGDMCKEQAIAAAEDLYALEDDLEVMPQLHGEDFYWAFEASRPYSLADLINLASILAKGERAAEIYRTIKKYELEYKLEHTKYVIEEYVLKDIYDLLERIKAKPLSIAHVFSHEPDAVYKPKNFDAVLKDLKGKLGSEWLENVVAWVLAYEHPNLTRVGKAYLVKYGNETFEVDAIVGFVMPLGIKLPELKKTLFIYKVVVKYYDSDELGITEFWYKFGPFKYLSDDNEPFEESQNPA